jgi:glycine/D-amino acid oxidase-like deaminating enzyme
MKRLAVVGAGLAGLSVVWHAINKGYEVTLFDPKGIGGGASGVSTGLLHPFAGKTASKSWQADRGMKATRELLEVAENAIKRPVASFTGIFRPAITVSQKIDFQKNREAVWKEISLPGMPPTFGLWIESGITVFSRVYLQGLWLAAEKKGAIFIQEKFESDASFDLVVLATGAETELIPECKHLPVRTAIGQSLVCKWDKALPFSLASQKYITLTEDPTLCQIGSTYEHTALPDSKRAEELLDKVACFYPPAKDFQIVEIRAGKRIAPREGHQPIVAQISPKTWVFTGLGSRGMLYHAMLGSSLVDGWNQTIRSSPY